MLDATLTPRPPPKESSPPPPPPPPPPARRRTRLPPRATSYIQRLPPRIRVPRSRLHPHHTFARNLRRRPPSPPPTTPTRQRPARTCDHGHALVADNVTPLDTQSAAARARRRLSSPGGSVRIPRADEDGAWPTIIDSRCSLLRGDALPDSSSTRAALPNRS